MKQLEEFFSFQRLTLKGMEMSTSSTSVTQNQVQSKAVAKSPTQTHQNGLSVRQDTVEAQRSMQLYAPPISTSLHVLSLGVKQWLKDKISAESQIKTIMFKLSWKSSN